MCQVLLSTEVVLQITQDYCWLFSLCGHPLLQTLVLKADWQYHGSTTFTVEYILFIEFGKYASYASCESLRVVASDFSLGVSPTFVTIALLLPANYSIFR